MDPYIRQYGVGFLDDLHNYFPDLLYRRGRLSPEFQYIRNQTRYLFTAQYSQGLVEYQSSPANIDTIQYIIAMLHAPPVSETAGLHTFLSFLDELEPVIVHPTPEQIAHATSIIPHTEVEESILCTICQDHPCPDDTTEWRKITSCGHLYHKKCIDRWFETSVFCPICRIDIRPA
jgi:hypothetical protein